MRKIALLSVSVMMASSLPALAQLTLNPSPARVVGHPRLLVSTYGPNLVEGREFLAPQGAAVDMSSGAQGPLYISDTGNNRVLGWRSATSFANGAAADAIIGQRDRYTTFSQGPAVSGSGFNSGLYGPTGLAVDMLGNLYVADAGNNRILRFPRPFDQKDSVKLPDMVIGQSNFTSGSPATSDKGLATNVSGSVFRVGLAFDKLDASGRPTADANLWVADAANNRVLRYPSAALRAGTNGPAADLVLGQPDFVTNKIPTAAAGVDPRTMHETAVQPSGIAFDQAGRLFVADAYVRVLVYTPDFKTGQSAARIMGVIPRQAGQTLPSGITNATLGILTSTQALPPEGMFCLGNTPYVIDTPNSRILQYDPFDQWPKEQDRFSPIATGVFGQNDFVTGKINRAQKEAGASSLNNPVYAAVAGSDVYLADSGNHRLLAFRSGSLEQARGVLGQDDFYMSSPNLVEGREFFLYSGFSSVQGVNAIIGDGVGMWVDYNSDPPALWVADTYNNRVLGFRDVRNVKPGTHADIVVGQGFSGEFRRVLVNFPNNDATQPVDTGLNSPVGVVVDKFGDLWVADAGNSRVLRFPNPWANAGGTQRANLVIGQASFTTRITDATSRTLARPVALALTDAGSLLVSDMLHNRVLFFERPAGGDFASGQAATKVFGQPDFATSTGVIGDSSAGMLFPHGIAVDVDERLYVADTGNNRLMVYDRVTAAPGTMAIPAFILSGVSSPHGVAISPVAGEIWVADTRNNRVVRYPSYFNLVIGTQTIQASVPAGTPLGLAVDGFGNVLVAENVNRISLYFPSLSTTNAASYSARPLSPGQIASIFTKGTGYSFGSDTRSFTDLPNPLPLPTSLADIAVTLSDAPVPLFFVSPNQINLQIPMGAPQSGTADMVVMRPSTGQVLAASTISFAPGNPALFTVDSSGSGQVLALNEDNTQNSTKNPAQRDHIVQLFGTGQGYVDKAPPDGSPEPDASATTGELPTVIIGSGPVPSQNVQFSGLAPGFVGLWQVNVKIPNSVPPGDKIPVALVYKSIPSTGGPDPAKPLQTTIAVKQ
jgi:uncharacterized protein (TIGR03437 family)